MAQKSDFDFSGFRGTPADEGEVREKFWRTAKKGRPPDSVHGGRRRRLLLRASTRTRRCAPRRILIAALGYFVLPADAIPDVIFGLGFTDDIAVLTAAITAVRAHITPAHRQAAKRGDRRRRADALRHSVCPSHGSATREKSNSCRFRALQVAKGHRAGCRQAAARKWRRFHCGEGPFSCGNSPFGNPD